MRVVAFQGEAFSDYSDWAEVNPKIFEEIRLLIKESARTPFEGTGKPEPLRHNKAGYWSRRINDEHRLVYKVTDEMITVISCKYHYE